MSSSREWIYSEFPQWEAIDKKIRLKNYGNESHNETHQRDVTLGGVITDTSDSSVSTARVNTNKAIKMHTTVQNLRFVKAAYLIAKYFPIDAQGKALTDALGENLNKKRIIELLKKHLKLSSDQAESQLIMARDLVVKLEEHPAVHTTVNFKDESGRERQLTSQTELHHDEATQRLYNEFYLDEDSKFDPTKTWLQDALRYGRFDNLWNRFCKFFGFGSHSQNTWYEKFWKEHAKDLREIDGPTSSTERYARTPAVYKKESASISIPDSNETYQMHWYGVGQVSPYESSNERDKVEAAKAQLKATLFANIDEAIKRFLEKYKVILEKDPGYIPDFFLSDIRILTPAIYDELALDRDNNNEFLEVMHQAMEELLSNQMFRKELTKIANEHGVNLVVTSTNHNFNELANLPTAYDTSEENDVQLEQKLQWVAMLRGLTPLNYESYGQLQTLIKYIKKPNLALPNSADAFLNNLENGKIAWAHYNLNRSLEVELAKRLRASLEIRKHLNRQGNDSTADTQQKKNIKLACLEVHCTGSQAHITLGCKSARDRKEVFVDAIKAMLADSRTMSSWDDLHKATIVMIQTGHGYVAQFWQVGIRKLKDVGEIFLEMGVSDLFGASKPLKKSLKPKKSRFLKLAKKLRQIAKGLFMLLALPYKIARTVFRRKERVKNIKKEDSRRITTTKEKNKPSVQQAEQTAQVAQLSTSPTPNSNGTESFAPTTRIWGGFFHGQSYSKELLSRLFNGDNNKNQSLHL